MGVHALAGRHLPSALRLHLPQSDALVMCTKAVKTNNASVQESFILLLFVDGYSSDFEIHIRAALVCFYLNRGLDNDVISACTQYSTKLYDFRQDVVLFLLYIYRQDQGGFIYNRSISARTRLYGNVTTDS